MAAATPGGSPGRRTGAGHHFPSDTGCAPGPPRPARDHPPAVAPRAARGMRPRDIATPTTTRATRGRSRRARARGRRFGGSTTLRAATDFRDAPTRGRRDAPGRHTPLVDDESELPPRATLSETSGHVPGLLRQVIDALAAAARSGPAKRARPRDYDAAAADAPPTNRRPSTAATAPSDGASRAPQAMTTRVRPPRPRAPARGDFASRADTDLAYRVADDRPS